VGSESMWEEHVEWGKHMVGYPWDEYMVPCSEHLRAAFTPAHDQLARAGPFP
jgi:hypothetical protein